MNRVSRKLLRRILLIAALVTCQFSVSVQAADKLSIAVIPKGTTHEFWKSIHAGAVKASRVGGGGDLERAAARG